jgi:hypothetical protein
VAKRVMDGVRLTVERATGTLDAHVLPLPISAGTRGVPHAGTLKKESHET